MSVTSDDGTAFSAELARAVEGVRDDLEAMTARCRMPPDN